MRRAFALSCLCHGALLLLAVALLRRPVREPALPRPLNVGVQPELLRAEILRAPPVLVTRPRDPPHEIEPLERPRRGPPEPEGPAAAGPVEPQPALWTFRGAGLCAKLKTPLRASRPAPAATGEPDRRPAPTRAAGRASSRPPLMLGAATGIEYPRQARQLGLEGSVSLRLCVGLEGRVTRVEVRESSGHPLLDRAAVSAARRWRFAAALRDGKPVVAWIERVVRFRLIS